MRGWRSGLRGRCGGLAGDDGDGLARHLRAVTRCANDGTTLMMRDAVRAEPLARHALALTHLGRHGMIAQPEGLHLWLPLSGGGWSTRCIRTPR